MLENQNEAFFRRDVVALLLSEFAFNRLKLFLLAEISNVACAERAKRAKRFGWVSLSRVLRWSYSRFSDSPPCPIHSV